MPAAKQYQRYANYPVATQRAHLSRANRINQFAPRAVSFAVRNILRRTVRHYIERKRVEKLAQSIASSVRSRKRRKLSKKKNKTIITASGGTTHTTTRLIVRKTPRQQKALRKYFKVAPLKNMFVNRFAFSWMGNQLASKTMWYSVCHLKFNNVANYFQTRITAAGQNAGTASTAATLTSASANTPDNMIYLGKCTYSYELYNPTNYIQTVYIYDLICKRDTPYPISYGPAGVGKQFCSPEACMYKSTDYVSNANTAYNNADWVVADPTLESATAYSSTQWNTIGMKPTDYHYFNTFWKVKGMKKIILPPTASHHHVVVYNPKKVFTNANLFFPRNDLSKETKIGLGGVTCATLFGFQGQVAVEDERTTDSDGTGIVGTLPGKLIVNCIRKENVWNVMLRSTNIVSHNTLTTNFAHATIFTDLVEREANDTGHAMDQDQNN